MAVEVVQTSFDAAVASVTGSPPSSLETSFPEFGNDTIRLTHAKDIHSFVV